MERHPELVENKLIFRENNKIFPLPRDAELSWLGFTVGGGRAQRKYS
jgi:hypothetical protein